MDKPKTNHEALKLVTGLCGGTQTALAKRLKVAKQLVNTWHAIPLQYAEQTANLVKLPIGYIVPEIENQIAEVLGRPPTEQELAGLIRIFIEPAMAWARRHTRKRK